MIKHVKCFLTQFWKLELKQECSYQGEALNVQTAFQDLWSSNNIKKFYQMKQNENFFF